MSPLVSPFERRARRIRKALRRWPTLGPAVDRIGILAWRWHLSRSARRDAERVVLPSRIGVEPHSIRLVLPERTIRELAHRDAHGGTGLVRGGSWDSGATPLRHEEVPADERSGGSSCDQVVVAIDRRGRLCLVSGRAALAEARNRGTDEIEALVALRHARWLELVRQVRAYARQRGGTAYQPYLHPDLRDLPSDHGHERFDLLLRALPIRRGALLDLGANAGYFCHRFEEVGFDCVAVERSKKELFFLTALRDAACRRFAVLPGSLTEIPLPPRVDVVLALNIFHHLLKTEKSYADLEHFLERLNSRYMLFQAHLPDDPQMAGAAHNMAPVEFADWVRARGGFATATDLGVCRDGRALFLLATADAGTADGESPQ